MFCLPLFRKDENNENEARVVSPPSYFQVLKRSGAGSAAVLNHLRAILVDNKVDAYIIPNEDEHGSEIPSASELRRGFMTGFHGSSGLAVITQTEALLFTDSRYWVAAEKAIDPRIWTLRKADPRAIVPGGFQDYLCNLPAGSRIAVDARLITPALMASLEATLPTGSRVIATLVNLVDQVWTDKPARSTDPVIVHPLKFSGRGADSKIAQLREEIRAYSESTSYLATSLDDLAWLLNLRGTDMFNQPLFYAYCFVSATEVVLFIDSRKITTEVREYLNTLNVQIQEYQTIWAFLAKKAQQDPKSQVLVDSKASYAVIQMLAATATVIHSPINTAKAIKNAVEIEGFFNGNLRDSVVMVRWYGWLHEQIVKKKNVVTEYEAERKLSEYRSKVKYWAGDCSFISAYGPSAALPHYHAEPDECLVIGREAPYLLDSGQQYFDSTIDTTRTVHFGKPTKEQKRAFTRVLQAHIAIDSLIFPQGTLATNLDGIVRHHLWKDGMNFGHGPGHGIGSYGVVHESSTGISVPFILKPGHVITNEPGFYDEGNFGCRTESTIVCVEKKTRKEFGGSIWLGFERFTMVPIQQKLVESSLLSKEEKKWLRAHNKLCYKKLRPLLREVCDKRAEKLLGRFF
ncbi:Xaa-Pro aminopeptidase [Mycena indigotica]|uniref:Xaa-Pro aminopeptidase n=1 Tax=Mycena indigotica TaxID=2126181 RepID=A0A8H6SLH6_9AGAR|nr:Xaa-Pro aminopeptidase [Mycena indigotica]KAF7301955.1 Xaa-Pro aminopeptidase [Mycena indigotica]